METFSGKITIEADIEIAGMVVGDVTVPSGRTMCLSGMVSGDVIVESIGCAIIRGMVNGCVPVYGESGSSCHSRSIQCSADGQDILRCIHRQRHAPSQSSCYILL
jgi:cytoskeletal protein CcmA (bactofilin family)